MLTNQLTIKIYEDLGLLREAEKKVIFLVARPLRILAPPPSAWLP